jgi:branched-chain amino acid transport system substrate-binding protein
MKTRLLLLVCLVALSACGSRLTPGELEAHLGRVNGESAAPGSSGAAGGSPDAAAATPHGVADVAPPAEAAPLREGVAANVVARGIGDVARPDASQIAGGPSPAGAARSSSAGTAGASTLQTTSAAADAAPGLTPRGRSEIVLGSFGTASGVVGAQVAAIPPATRAWMADVNARGGLAGHPVRVVFGDDGGDPHRALALVRRMVESDGAVALVATYSVNTMDAVASYLEAKSVPVVGATGGSAVEDSNPMIFNPTLGADHGIAWSYLLTIAAQTDKRKLSILYCGEASTCANQYRRIKQLVPRMQGLSIVHEAQVSIVQPDYTAEVIAARNAGAEVVISVMDSQSIIRIIRSAHRQGWKPMFSATHNLNTGNFRSPGDDLDGTLAASTTVPYTTSPKMTPYLSAMKRYAPSGEIGGYGSSAWVHGKLIEALAPAWAKDRPTSADVVDALYGLHNETLGGLITPITFNRGAHRAVNLCVVPLRYKGGTFEPPQGGDGAFACPPGFVPGDPAASRAAVP